MLTDHPALRVVADLREVQVFPAPLVLRDHQESGVVPEPQEQPETEENPDFQVLTAPQDFLVHRVNLAH